MLDDYLLGPIVIATPLAVLLIKLRWPWKLAVGTLLLMAALLIWIYLPSLRADCYPTFFVIRYQGWCSNSIPNPGGLLGCESPSELLGRGLGLGGLVGLLWPIRRPREENPETF
jgi:hypothetical protein